MANKEEILAGLAEIVNEETGVEVEDVQLDKSFTEDLDIDSISMMTIVVNAEEKFEVTIPDEEVKNHIQRWRAANPRIVQFWKRLDTAFRAGGGPVGEHIRVRRDDSDQMQILLPSGRAVCYRAPRIIRAEKFGEMRDVISFMDSSARTPTRVQTYGGRLTENVTQAVARDLLAWALVEMDAMGVPSVAHVHDEILVDGGDVDAVAAIMGEDEIFRPKWAKGLPLSAEGYQCIRYRKG